MSIKNKKIYLALVAIIVTSCSAKSAKNEVVVSRAPGSMHDFCESVSRIHDVTESCDDNDKFVGSAEACLEKFEKEIKVAGINIHTPDDAKMFDREGGADSSEVSSTSSAENITDFWINKGQQAISELKVYTEQLNYPEDAEDEDEHGSNPEDYANSVDCYGESKKSIESVVDDFHYYLEQLEDLKKSVRATILSNEAK